MNDKSRIIAFVFFEFIGLADAESGVAALVGVDFAEKGGSTPSRWNAVVTSPMTTLTNLRDEDG